MSISKNVYINAFCVIIALFLCVLIGSGSYNFGNRVETGHVWYQPINPLNDSNIKIMVNKENVNNENISFVNAEIFKLKLQNSKQKQEDIHENVIKEVQPMAVLTLDRGVFDLSNCSKRECNVGKSKSDSKNCSKTDVKSEKCKLKSKGSKQKQKNIHGNVIKQYMTVRTVDSSIFDLSNCSKRDVKLFETAQPVTGLVSFPGSGNTWTRHLIQQMTGIGTSSVYCDGTLKKRGFPHECERQWGKTIVVKTHEAKHFAMFKKIVLLVRNPYDALLSYANFAKAGHTGHPSKRVLIQASARIFNHSLTMYVSIIRNTTGNFKGPVHVVQYEKLKAHIAEELRSLAMFLNATASNNDIDCTVRNQEGNFHRQTIEAQHIELLRAVYNKEKLLRLRHAAQTSEKLLKDAYGIELDLGSAVEKTFF